MNTEDLRTFVEVADAGGVTAAARRLGIAKAVVSRQLIRLETELGVQLLARTTRGASLTEAGATFREHAAKIIADLDTARETILPEGELRGRLRISAPLSFGPTHLAPVLAQLARSHPALHVQTCYSDRFVNIVEEGFDCAIRFGRPAPSTLLSKRIAPLHATLVASPEYISRHGSPETPEELLKHEALLQGTEPWDFIDGDKTFTLNVEGRFKADNGVAITAAALGWIRCRHQRTSLLFPRPGVRTLGFQAIRRRQNVRAVQIEPASRPFRSLLVCYRRKFYPNREAIRRRID